MDAARWSRLQVLFHDALSVPESDRERWLDEVCREDASLRDDLRRLLAADARATSWLDRGAAGSARALLEPDVHPETIGPYRIRRVLGCGGMGVVYLAEREDLGSHVAVKVLRAPLVSALGRTRFDDEARTLARLNHPSIARLFDAGTLPDGTPYMVMEYVQGESLMAYCERAQCDVEQRLDLFREVAEAVDYAHRQAIIHRDLKPSNILVAPGETGGAPAVKLLDFGIAKPLDRPDLWRTQTGQWVMTPAYAAPEQLRGEAVGVFTDVYALGVMLYELLTGTSPYDLTDCTPGEVEQIVLGQEPEKPSVRAVRTGRVALRSWPDRQAWADLDVLCLKAMHKDPARRYASVEALLRDLRHVRQREPLEARPDTPGYRLGLFVRRNRRAVLATALGAVAFMGVVGFYTWRLRSARDAALQEAARAQRIERFMMALFEDGDVSVGPPDSLRVTTLLERGVREAQMLEAEPDVQTELYMTLGRLYQQLGDLDRADSLLSAALRQREGRLGAGHPSVARSRVALGRLRNDQAAFEEAERLIREGLVAIRRHLPARHPAEVEALTALGHALTEQGGYDRAVAVLEEAARLQTDADPASLSETLTELANAHFYAGRYASSDSLNRLVLALDQRHFGRRHPRVAGSLINLGATRHQLGYFEEAEGLYRQALEINLAYFGPDRVETAANLRMLGQTLAFQGRYDEALEVLRPALALHERVYGRDHPNIASLLNELGTVALQQDDFARAEAFFSRMVAIYRAVYQDDHYYTGIGLANLASVYLAEGRYDRAEPLFRDALALFTRTLGEAHIQTGIARIKLGRVLLRSGRPEEATGELRTGYDILNAQTSPSVSWLQAARGDLAEAYERLGNPEQAAVFRSERAAAEAAHPDR